MRTCHQNISLALDVSSQWRYRSRQSADRSSHRLHAATLQLAAVPTSVKVSTQLKSSLQLFMQQLSPESTKSAPEVLGKLGRLFNWLINYVYPELNAEYLRQLISSQHSGSSMTMTLRSSTRPLLQAPRTRTAYGSRGTIYQPQSSKRAACLFFVADSRHICLL